MYVHRCGERHAVATSLLFAELQHRRDNGKIEVSGFQV